MSSRKANLIGILAVFFATSAHNVWGAESRSHRGDLLVQYAVARVRAAELQYQRAVTLSTLHDLGNSGEQIEKLRGELKEAANALVDTLAGESPIQYTDDRQLRHAQAGADVALREYEKLRDLHREGGAVSPHDVESARVQHELKSLEVQILRALSARKTDAADSDRPE